MPKIIITQALVDGKNGFELYWITSMTDLRSLSYIMSNTEDWCFPHYLISFSKKYCSTNLV